MTNIDKEALLTYLQRRLDAALARIHAAIHAAKAQSGKEKR